MKQNGSATTCYRSPKAGRVHFVCWTKLTNRFMNGPSGMRRRPEANAAAIEELSELITFLLASARRLPPGPERHAAMKQIGSFQVRLDTIEAQSKRASLHDKIRAQPAVMQALGGD
jgi:hypothetical protein